MVIRNAEAKDCEQCLTLLRQLWKPAYDLDSIQEGTFSSEDLNVLYGCILDNPNCEVVIAEKDERVVAMMDLSFRETFLHGGLMMQIEDLIVDAKYRRQGIGQRMVGLAEEMAVSRGCRAAELNSDLYREATHRFWEAMGYEIGAYQLRKAL
ncbi:MAG TPA: GNAT family N-acetyltransferase [Candidatus Eisenbacteria bacterium]|uniref:GNAT family N-acetyltransferase n=1 Tax=Eiseniibacteriota bacterium TaxID=2212470 RepID=A0A7V2AUX0_UNCEI|nr:GNAT family N-acetyltransferase [Candidatus Eisenbacteria bacterium]